MTDTPATNTPEFSVSEISTVLKRTVEQNFSHVRVRGEISGFKKAASGHLYMALKDDRSVLDAVCWRGTAQKLAIRPEDGLEVIATGRLTTYPGRSKYQIVIEAMELAGEGALLKLLEERKRKLEAEGLFAPERKKPIPFLPSRIGVVTSPTGAVIRDILHRLADRFPSHVLLWPVLVQGDGAADQVATAVRGFNRLDAALRPDLVIVARGGGSLEDLWAFNEEAVVRAVAESTIPVISAVGHETDVTLVDFAADQRAPTPTAAAEMAVPVRRDLLAGILDLERRLVGSWGRLTERAAMRIDALSRGLPAPQSLLEGAAQTLDEQTERMVNAIRVRIRHDGQVAAATGNRLRGPTQFIAIQQDRLGQYGDRAAAGLNRRWARAAASLQDQRFPERLDNACGRHLRDTEKTLEQLARRLESVSYRNVLERGFAIVQDADGTLVRKGSALKSGQAVTLQFADTDRTALIGGEPGGTVPKKRKAPAAKAATPPKQERLL